MLEQQPGSCQHVLFDADGVLQHLPGGWGAALQPHLGSRTEEFLAMIERDELGAMIGQEDFLPLLADRLTKYEVATPAAQLFAEIWQNIEISDASLALVAELKTLGYGVHLGTNQEQHRGTYMRRELGFDQLFEVSCYSYDLGYAKPDPRYFSEAARRIGASPKQILFIDNHLDNVQAAAGVGLGAIHWALDDGHHALRAHLATHGVTFLSI